MKITLTIEGLDEKQAADVLEKISTPSNQMELFEAKKEFQPIPEEKIVPGETIGAGGSAAVVEAPTDLDINVDNFPAAPADDVERDAEGLPWDERIHAGSKKQTAKGVWKRKRGLQDFEYDEVVAELKADIPAAPAEPEVPVVPEAAEPAVPEAPATPAAPPAPVAAVPPAPAPAEVPARDYNGLITKIQQDFNAGIVGEEYANTIVNRINDGFKTSVSTIVDIADNDEMVAYAWQCVDVDTQARAA